jgi:hypothetical protein
MADIAGTNLVEGLWKTGEQFTVVGKYDVAESLSEDTLTFSDILPNGVKKIIDAELTLTGALDSSGSPTGDVELGIAPTDGGSLDANGLILTQLVSGTGQLSYKGDGAYIGANTTARDIVATFNAQATAVTTGVTVWVKCTYVCGLDNNG